MEEIMRNTTARRLILGGDGGLGFLHELNEADLGFDLARFNRDRTGFIADQFAIGSLVGSLTTFLGHLGGAVRGGDGTDIAVRRGLTALRDGSIDPVDQRVAGQNTCAFNTLFLGEAVQDDIDVASVYAKDPTAWRRRGREFANFLLTRIDTSV